jgi:hypothetical protein
MSQLDRLGVSKGSESNRSGSTRKARVGAVDGVTASPIRCARCAARRSRGGADDLDTPRRHVDRWRRLNVAEEQALALQNRDAVTILADRTAAKAPGLPVGAARQRVSPPVRQGLEQHTEAY